MVPDMGRRVRTRPPDPAVMLVVAALLLSQAAANTEFRETIVTGVRTLTMADSPYMVREDVLVAKEGELVIEAGVTLRFQQGVGITVRGVLNAQGREGSRITLTSAEEVGRQENRTIRLVDGPTVNQGIIQVRRDTSSGNSDMPRMPALQSTIVRSTSDPTNRHFQRGTSSLGRPAIIPNFSCCRPAI